LDEHVGITILHCSGRICFQKEAELLALSAVEQLRSGRNVILDIGEVEALDSAGIGQLVLIHMQARASDRDICIVAASEQVQRLLALTNVASLFDFFDSAEDAICRWSEEVA
jgi:anti-anti-sigma factor